jgi:hypothetical protein
MECTSLIKLFLIDDFPFIFSYKFTFSDVLPSKSAISVYTITTLYTQYSNSGV